MESASWSTPFPMVGHHIGDAPNNEDWEDWLRWDPVADAAASPEEGTVNSGSSKNDSPVQDSVYPVADQLFGKNETLAPPLIVGEDTLDFSSEDQTAMQNDSFLFGADPDISTSATFDFQTSLPSQEVTSKLDTDAASWHFPLNLDVSDVTMSALPHDDYQTLQSAGTISSHPPSTHHSPESTTLNGTSVSSTSPGSPKKKRGGRKRKVEVEQANEQGGDSNEDGDEPPMKKTSHNVIEKRYRNNLNDKIVELRNSVPSLRALGRASGDKASEDLEGLTPAHKLNKATVMAKATEYIHHLEKRNKNMADEMDALKSRLSAVETAIGRSRDRRTSMGSNSTGATVRSRQVSSSSSTGAQGFLNVPSDQTRFGQQFAQQQYTQTQGHPTYHRQPAPPVDAQNQQQQANGGGGGLMSKVVMGTMAGLMAMEGLHEQQQSADGSHTNGLAAIPTQLLRRAMGSSATGSEAAPFRQLAVPLLKLCLIMAALVYILAPLFTVSQHRKQKSRHQTVRLPDAPSLASPIEVRRKAWLTAIQTVWVPKHFLLEVVAVTCKMISLSVRRLIGTEAYNVVTGYNKEEESARIKAWDIAIDAQLAGGDAEVSYYRLLLTLMEGGTLPDSPARLMQKAVHFRVFFWEVANAGYGNMIGFKHFTEKVGKIYWDSAHRQHKELLQAKSEGRSGEFVDGVEILPDHLSLLVKLDCDEVLSDEMIQRAWNLAWNKPSAHGTLSTNAARDAVVEDHAIRSPLDAVAAWYANMVIDDTIANTLGEHPSEMDTEHFIGLAVSVSPPGSATQARALATKALLCARNRERNLLVALDALVPPGTASSCGNINVNMNVVNHLPAAPDVRTALTLAKLLSLGAPDSPPIARRRALDSVATLHISPATFTLLTAIGAFRLVRLLAAERNLPLPTKHGLEDLAANLRVWVGTSSSAGRESDGLGSHERARIVEVCLGVAKQVGGWNEETDSGYGSVEGSPVITKRIME